MLTVKYIKRLRSILNRARSRKQRIGFVPTMGALHEGHLSLIRKCRRENDLTVLSIFVNPKQFGPREDFKAYPRPEKKDKLLAKKEKVDIIFYPSGKEMYPSGFLTNINVDRISSGMCGATRPGHFRGVATVVGILLNIVQPDALYLGQKDAQQVVVLKRMVADLNFPVSIRVGPTVREQDGLAMSSRNQYLTPRQRRDAVALYASLRMARKLALAGEHNSGSIIRRMRQRITTHSEGIIDYIACVNADSLLPLKKLRGNVMIALAVKFGQTRLIDNIQFRIR